MAEIGTVAAVLQLTELAFKLRRLCSEIRHAPAELLDLVEEITVLADMIDGAQWFETNADEDDQSSRAWHKSYQLLKTSTELLKRLVSELDKSLASHKSTGVLRVWLKRDEIKRYSERLERCKSTMNLALQLYTQASFKQQQLRMLRQIHELVTQPQKQPADSSVPTQVDASSDHVHTDLYSPISQQTLAINNDKIHNTTRRVNPRKTYRLKLPSWLLRAGVQVLYERGTNSRGLSFRTYNQVPWGSEVFQAATRGDWNYVELLIQQGKASPFDVDPEDRTLLHYAARRHDTIGCKMLLGFGLDPSYRSSVLRETPLEIVGWQLEVFNSAERMQRCDESFMALLDAYPESISIQEESELQYAMGYLPPASLIALKKATFPPYETLATEEKVMLAIASIAEGNSLQTFQMMLGPSMDLSSAFKSLDSALLSGNRASLLNHAMSRMVESLHRGDTASQTEWKGLIAQAVDTARFTSSAYRFDSLYLCFIQNYIFYFRPRMDCGVDWNSRLTSIGHIWLEVLSHWNIDLLRYGAAEKLAMNPYKSRRFHLYSRNGTFHWIIKYLIIGRTIQDWKVFVVPHRFEQHFGIPGQGFTKHVRGHMEYEMAGEFWDWIENPEMFQAPGSYIEDEAVDDIEKYV